MMGAVHNLPGTDARQAFWSGPISPGRAESRYTPMGSADPDCNVLTVLRRFGAWRWGHTTFRTHLIEHLVDDTESEQAHTARARRVAKCTPFPARGSPRLNRRCGKITTC